MNASAGAPLVFSWDPPRKRRRALIVFLILSVALHALCFYIFQIVYPPTVALMPPPARVTLISPDDPESLALLRWVEAEDPALTTTTQRLPEAKSLVLPPIRRRPSYASHQPKLKTPPPLTPDLSLPSSAATGPVRLRASESRMPSQPGWRAKRRRILPICLPLWAIQFSPISNLAHPALSTAYARFRVCNRFSMARFSFAFDRIFGRSSARRAGRNLFQLAGLRQKKYQPRD